MSDKNNILDYVFWRGDLSFESDPFNEVDGLVFSVLAYANLEIIETTKNPTIGDLSYLIRFMDIETDDFGPQFLAKRIRKLIQAVSESKRYKDVKIKDYYEILDDEVEMQFAATTFELPDKTLVVAYRGTDESLIGWKEDLNLSFIDGVAAQIEAEKYADKVIKKTTKKAILTGHSKGGNIAVWAATKISDDKKKKIAKIYSNDAPGFSESFLASDDYKEIRDRIESFVPESSIVGILLEHDEYTTIESKTIAVFQHDPFTWNLGGGSFVYTEKRTIIGQQMDYWVNAWIKSLTKEEREEFVECIWKIISSANAKTLNDLNAKKIKSTFSMQKAFIKMEPSKRKMMFIVMNKLIIDSISHKFLE